MKKDSIFFSITINFIMALLLIVLSGATLLFVSHKNCSAKYFDKYHPIVSMVSRQVNKIGEFTPNFKNNLDELGYMLMLDRDKINAITYNHTTKVLFERRLKRHTILLRVLSLNDKVYVYIKDKNTTYLLEDKEPTHDMIEIYIVLILLLLIAMSSFVYYSTWKKLVPLKLLKDKIESLGDENFEFEYNTTKQDEISLLALEFKKTALKLKNIKDARNVFIRNIMHELKTPIIKGKFLTELPKTEQNNEKMQNVFSRLELLINEFSSIEEVISSTKQIESSNYFLNDIVDNAIDILFLEDEAVVYSFSNIKLNVNFKLFSIAVKNLIDNAIKYSNNGQVTIKTNEDGSIVFENSGNSLKYELDSYFEPFFANSGEKNSFGLGLYIVNSILKASDYYLEYEYENDINRFIIKKVKATK